MPIDSFAKRLQKALNIRGIKSTELAKKTKIDKSLISNYLAGNYKAKQDKVAIISDFLNVNPAWLMGFDVPMERKDNNSRLNDELQEKIESLNNEQKKAIINIIDNMK